MIAKLTSVKDHQTRYSGMIKVFFFTDEAGKEYEVGIDPRGPIMKRWEFLLNEEIGTPIDGLIPNGKYIDARCTPSRVQ